jgi:hypothetical protein
VTLSPYLLREMLAWGWWSIILALF